MFGFFLLTAIREGLVEIDSPWENINVKKNMPSLKFYHDMTWGKFPYVNVALVHVYLSEVAEVLKDTAYVRLYKLSVI